MRWRLDVQRDVEGAMLQTVAAMSTTGLAVFGAGMALSWGALVRWKGLSRAIALGPVFVAAPLATFGAMHFSATQDLSQAVPAWMPWRVFWTYLAGAGLIATAVSLVAKRMVRWSGLLCGCMMFAFVAMIHLPNSVAHAANRFGWTVVVREGCFGLGLLALAAVSAGAPRAWRWMIPVSRIWLGATAVFYAVEHFLHPMNTPGLPLEQIAPAWFPVPWLWGYLTGAVLLATGVLMLANKRAREAAAWLGVAETLVTVGIYVPILMAARGTAQIVEGIDYVADTLLFAGTAFLVAGALSQRAHAVVTLPVEMRPELPEPA